MGIANVQSDFEGFSKKDSNLDSDLLFTSNVLEITYLNTNYLAIKLIY